MLNYHTDVMIIQDIICYCYIELDTSVRQMHVEVGISYRGCVASMYETSTQVFAIVFPIYQKCELLLSAYCSSSARNRRLRSFPLHKYMVDVLMLIVDLLGII